MPTETGLRETLRWTTQDVHDRLHENPSFLALMDGTLSLADYAALMQRLYGFYAAVDVAIRKALPASAWCGFDYAPRAPLLSDDVASLHPDLALAPARDIRCTAVAGIVRPDTVLGVLYVVEGAMLGGARLDRAAARILPTSSPRGRMFWAWCRSEGKQRWPRFLALMQAHPLSPSDQTRLAQNAQATFLALEGWLEPLNVKTCEPEEALS